MTSETALTLRETMDLGSVLVKSGYFKDANDASQAVVKVLAGREMGFGPIASMQGIHIIQGKPTTGANLLGASIKRSGRYNYRVAELTDTVAEIAFFEGSEEVGRSRFSMDDAKAAGLTGKDNWRKFPRNMLFARALSNGARWYCPDVFSGVTPYTPEELGAEVDGETGDVIDVTPTPVAAPAPSNGGKANGHTRPLDAETVRAFVRKKAGWQDGQRLIDGEPITEKQIPKVATDMGELFPNLDNKMRQKARHDVLRYIIGVDSTKDLYKAEASALIDWCVDQDNAQAEAARILKAMALDAGQQELPM